VEGRPLTEAELIVAAKNGDVEAYEQLVQLHQSMAQRVAMLITRSSADAQDAAQEAFVKAFYALDRFRDGAPFRPWLLRIVANEARNRIRSEVRKQALVLRSAQASPSGEAAPSPEEALMGRDSRERLLAFVEGLPDADREAISLRFFAELGEAEMSEVLGIPKGTVKSRVSRALKKLRNAMGEEERWT
jgi:RNA polymerase sigma factor (sigma-70 family)